MVGQRFPVPKSGAQAKGPRGVPPKLPVCPFALNSEELQRLTVLVNEDVHSIHRDLILHGSFGPTDDLQDRTILLGSYPVDDLSLSIALET